MAHSVSCLLLGADVRAVQPEPEALREVSDELSREHRWLWFEQTKGTNLALGRPVSFEVAPNYPLTRDVADAQQLTDGKLTMHPRDRDDKIWHAPTAVGWARRNPAVVTLDLGDVRAISRVVVRCLGGNEQGTLAFPSRIRLFLSCDGRSFFEAGTLTKACYADKPSVVPVDELSPVRYFHLPEENTSYVYPFVFPGLNTAARYVTLSATAPRDYLFMDELAVIAAATPADRVDDRGLPRVAHAVTGLLTAPVKDVLSISTNILTPNIFFLRDYRAGPARRSPITYTLELPREVTLLPTRMTTKYTNEIHSHEDIVRDGLELTRWRIRDFKCRWFNDRNCGLPGPFYLRVPADTRRLTASRAWVYAESDGCPPNKFSVPVDLIEIPKVPSFERFHVSLSWMMLAQQLDWPGFLPCFRHLGFNAIGAFPAKGWLAPDHPSHAASMRHLSIARAAGFQVVCCDSPFHFMWNKHGGQAEIAPQTGVVRAKSKLCPSYRGRFYTEELERVAAACRALQPDVVFWDFEIMRNDLFADAPNCQRCKTAFQAKGAPDWDEFITDQCTAVLRDLRVVATRAAAECTNPAPVIGSYHVSASGMRTVPAEKAYPEAVDLLMPSLYCWGNVPIVHEAIVRDYELARKRVVIPYLTTGTYGDVEPRDIELMIYECFLNGAAGITYYCFADFDSSLEYAAHARALRTLAPFENLLWDGTPADVTSDNSSLTVSSWGTSTEMLVLLGNYARSSAQSATLHIGSRAITGAVDLDTAEPVPHTPELRVEVEPNDAVLLHIQTGP